MRPAVDVDEQYFANWLFQYNVWMQTSMEVGAVCDLVDIKEAVLTARLVMQHTSHSMLAGLAAANFAVEMGLPAGNLTTDASAKNHADW